MTTETAPTPQTGVAETTNAGQRIAISSLASNLRDYGLVLALIAIMVFFQFATNGTMFKPLNISNLVQQMSALVLPPQLQNAAIFIVFLLIVMLRPQGLFGRSAERA